MNNDTMYIKNNVLNQNSAKELVEYINNNKELFVDWRNYINTCVEMRGCSYEKFAKLTGFSKNTIRSWCVDGSLPKNRNMFIKFAFGLNLNIDDTNKLLTKYGKYSSLYAKDIYDAITIYVINRRIQDRENENYQYDSLAKWFDKFIDIRSERFTDGKYSYQPKTMGVYNLILSITDDKDFEEFILNNKVIFLSPYNKLYEFIDDFINIRRSELEDENDDNKKYKYSWHRMLKEKHLDQSFEKMLSNLKNHGIVPKREQLIALGIHLNMVASDINNMLSLAKMQALYAKDKVESLLLYLLKNAVIEDPDLEWNNANKYLARSSSHQFKKEYEQIIEKYLDQSDLPEWDNCIESLAEYIRKQLIDLDMENLVDQIL